MVIIESLFIMLLGMIGIFIVMGVIFVGLKVLHHFSPAVKPEKKVTPE